MLFDALTADTNYWVGLVGWSNARITDARICGQVGKTGRDFGEFEMSLSSGLKTTQGKRFGLKR